SQKLNEVAPVRRLGGLAEAERSDALVTAQWPNTLDSLADTDAEEKISTIQGPIRRAREIKNEYNIQTIQTISAIAQVDVAQRLNDNAELICYMAGAKEFKAGADIEKPKNAATAIVDDIQIYVHDVIDLDAEKQRLEKQKAKIEKATTAVEAKLNNENFVSKAKSEVVARAREKLAELSEQLKTVEKHLSELND
ncbi:unnamed protein product, partial [marine sediment metagenome]